MQVEQKGRRAERGLPSSGAGCRRCASSPRHPAPPAGMVWGDGVCAPCRRRGAPEHSWKQAPGTGALVKGRSCAPIARCQRRRDSLVTEERWGFPFSSTRPLPPLLSVIILVIRFPSSLLLSVQTVSLGKSKRKACKEDAHKIFMENCGEHK